MIPDRLQSGVSQPSTHQDTHADTGQDRSGATLDITEEGKPDCRQETDRRRDADLDQSGSSVTFRSANGIDFNTPTTRRTCVCSSLSP